ncbi:MAG: nucleotidyltransferase family protein [Microcoleaceae cyanobacterium]
MNTTQEAIVDCLRQQLDYLREQFYVKRIGLFGSFATETATATSDVDLVIEFDQPIGLRFVDLCDYLEACLGRKVDVLTPAGIATIRNRSVAESIARSLVYV